MKYRVFVIIQERRTHRGRTQLKLRPYRSPAVLVGADYNQCLIPGAWSALGTSLGDEWVDYAEADEAAQKYMARLGAGAVFAGIGEDLPEPRSVS